MYTHTWAHKSSLNINKTTVELLNSYPVAGSIGQYGLQKLEEVLRQ